MSDLWSNAMPSDETPEVVVPEEIGLTAAEVAAIAELVVQTKPRVMRFALYKTGGDRPLAEDALQEAYLRLMLVWRNRSHLSVRQQLGWLRGTVKNVLLEEWRKRKRAEEHANRKGPPPGEVLTEDLSAGEIMLDDIIRIAEAALTPVELLAWLGDLYGVETKETARQIGCVDSTVRSHRNHARKKLMQNPTVRNYFDGFRKRGR
jgi:RNA polymerase sigma factor (sigma-70 family)